MSPLRPHTSYKRPSQIPRRSQQTAAALAVAARTSKEKQVHSPSRLDPKQDIPWKPVPAPVLGTGL